MSLGCAVTAAQSFKARVSSYMNEYSSYMYHKNLNEFENGIYAGQL